MQYAQGPLQVLSNFMATKAMQHDNLALSGTLPGVVVIRVRPPNASAGVNPGYKCRVLPTMGRSTAQSF